MSAALITTLERLAARLESETRERLDLPPRQPRSEREADEEPTGGHPRPALVAEQRH